MLVLDSQPYSHLCTRRKDLEELNIESLKKSTIGLSKLEIQFRKSFFAQENKEIPKQLPMLFTSALSLIFKQIQEKIINISEEEKTSEIVNSYVKNSIEEHIAKLQSEIEENTKALSDSADTTKNLDIMRKKNENEELLKAFDFCKQVQDMIEHQVNLYNKGNNEFLETSENYHLLNIFFSESFEKFKKEFSNKFAIFEIIKPSIHSPFHLKEGQLFAFPIFNELHYDNSAFETLEYNGKNYFVFLQNLEPLFILMKLENSNA